MEYFIYIINELKSSNSESRNFLLDLTMGFSVSAICWNEFTSSWILNPTLLRRNRSHMSCRPGEDEWKENRRRELFGLGFRVSYYHKRWVYVGDSCLWESEYTIAELYHAVKRTNLLSQIERGLHERGATSSHLPSHLCDFSSFFSSHPI